MQLSKDLVGNQQFVAVRTLNMINLLEKAIDAMSFIFQIHQKTGWLVVSNPSK